MKIRKIKERLTENTDKYWRELVRKRNNVSELRRKGAKAVPELARVLKEENDVMTRLNAVDVLAEIRGRKAVEQLLIASRDPNEMVRLRAIDILQQKSK